jgi:hypothetical protein
MYSFRELLDLFQLSSNISVEELKRAKMMVLKMHPDKSRLPPDYFLFYKKAFDIIVQYYQDNNKATAEVPQTKQTYTPLNGPADKNTYKTVNSVINEMGADQFQQKFNALFETVVEKPKDMNDWFRENDPLFQYDEVSSTGGISAAIDTVKQKSAALIKYGGVQSMNSGGPSYNHLYDTDEDYVSCDPFGKLKFDDLRKVHKDQTVLAVSERDYETARKYSSMDHLQRERGSLQVQHVDRSEHERFFAEQQEAIKAQMAAKQHAANLKSMEYAEKNKTVMASFLQIRNG